MKVKYKGKNVKLSHFALTGKVGRYTNYDNALNAVGQENPEDTISLPEANFNKHLKRELYKVVRYRHDLDIDSYKNFLGTKTIDIMKYLQSSGMYTEVYINRIVEKGNYRFALLVNRERELYYYCNNNPSLKYGKESDIIPLVYLKRLAKEYDLKGKIITHIPLEDKASKILPEWEYVKHSPTKYNILMDEVNRILLEEPTKFTINKLGGGI